MPTSVIMSLPREIAFNALDGGDVGEHIGVGLVQDIGIQNICDTRQFLSMGKHHLTYYRTKFAKVTSGHCWTNIITCPLALSE